MHIEVGKVYYIETVTKYWIGRVTSVDGPSTVTIVDCDCVFSTGRLSEFYRTGGIVAGNPIDNLEIEPLPNGQENQVTYLTITEWNHAPIRRPIP